MHPVHVICYKYSLHAHTDSTHRQQLSGPLWSLNLTYFQLNTIWKLLSGKR